ncbi:hypothetical protein V8E53_000919 [Lactarius tabidus]
MQQGPVGIADVTRGLIQGVQTSWSNNIFRLKFNMGRLASKTVSTMTNSDSCSYLCNTMKNSAEILWHKFIGIRHVRAKIHEGLEEYQVTSRDMPSFLFEDPDKVNPENVLAGFMQGFFLACIWPQASMQCPTSRERPTWGSVAHLCRIKTVTVLMIVYIAIQAKARFALSSQQTWSSKDGLFNYKDFAEILLQVWLMVNVQSGQWVSPMGPLCCTNTQVTLSSTMHSERILTTYGANREDHKDAHNNNDNNDDSVPVTPSRKRTFQEQGDDEDENLEPRPSQRVHPSKQHHAADTVVTSIQFMTDSKTN